MKKVDNTILFTVDIEPETGPNWQKGETLTINVFVTILVLKVGYNN